MRRSHVLWDSPDKGARYIDPKTGRRSDTAHQFIYNQEENANLQVLDQKRVVRVLFEYEPHVESIERCLNGFAYPGASVPLELSTWMRLRRTNPILRLNEPSRLNSSYYPPVLSVLLLSSSGMQLFRNPERIQLTGSRSGIGASEILKKNDIAQLVDLPGVGENYNGQCGDTPCRFLN